MTEIDSYLHQLRSELSIWIDDARVEELVGEAGYWLDRKVADLAMEGVEPSQANRQAVREHEQPGQLAATLVEEWFENQVDSPLLNRLGRANALAFAYFGMGNLAFLILLQVVLAFPSETLRSSLSPAAVHTYLPDQFPIPEPSWQFICLVGYPTIAPILLGWLAGRAIPVRAPHAIYRALTPVILSAFLLGCLLLPNALGLMYALYQTIFWLPAGCFAAYLAAKCHRARWRNGKGSTAGTHAPGPKRIGAT